MESPIALQDNSLPMEQEDVLFPCKGCGDILEEGKAFELAGNRWHIDCFRCNTCNTLLDSDANLLLLGDGSLICNNCTYSCTACGNKIEDLAILTGDQAFCASCFKCRNCKRKIENLRYARTSQGIFCMQCHESLMARRRKKNRAPPARTTSSMSAGSGGPVVLDKSLPALPPHIMTDGAGSSPDQTQKDDPTSASSLTPAASLKSPPAEPSNEDEDFFIPVTLDTTPQPPPTDTQRTKGASDLLDQSQLEYLNSRKTSASTAYRDAYSDYVQSSSRSQSADRQGSQSRGSSRNPPLRKQAPVPNQTGSPISPPSEFEDPLSRDRFKLQDAPKGRSGTSQSGSPTTNLAPTQATSPPTDTGVFGAERAASPDLSNYYKGKSNNRKSPLSTPSENAGAFQRPAREDSMRPPPGRQQQQQQQQPPISRKEAPRVDPSAQVDSSGKLIEQPVGLTYAFGNQQDAGNNIPVSRTLETSPGYADDIPVRSPRRLMAAAPTKTEEDSTGFSTPRIPPLAPSYAEQQRQKQAESTPAQYADDTDEANRAAQGDDSDHTGGLFRKVSKAVRHGRSQSDKIGSSSPKFPRGTRNASVDISSPIPSSMDPMDENIELRNKLRYTQQRIAELEAEKVALQEKVNGTVDIRQVNTELREKRSTMAILDTQRELVVRELEVITEQLHKAKDTDGPVNMEQLKSEVMREFAASVAKLKDTLSGQIEDLISKKNELTNEISTLIQMKDKGFQEYESLSTRNAQLLEVNNQLVHQIQDLYKQGKQPSQGGINLPPSNGLGIYAHHRSEASFDNKSSLAGDSHLSGDTEIEPATVLTAPQVVNIRKGQPKKFNWKKGSQAVAKNVSKGFRGAFSSTQSSSNLRDDNFDEGVPYANIAVTGEAPITGTVPLAPSRMGSDQGRQAWGLVSQKERSGTPTGLAAPREATGISSSTSSLPLPDASTTLFGSDLTARCEYERRIVPSLVTACIEEVSQRGLQAEGIYRKSGSSTQVKAIQSGFEKDHLGFSISDPDLDIHAVTGTLKQYFRKLPNPLITFEAYDPMLEAIAGDADDYVKASRLREVVAALPKCHRDTLEYLISHLASVIDYNSENLMSSLNIAVVFAPTIMRPSTIEREMTDMQAQRTALQCLLDNNSVVFGSD